jgi:hypothetical protein
MKTYNKLLLVIFVVTFVFIGGKKILSVMALSYFKSHTQGTRAEVSAVDIPQAVSYHLMTWGFFDPVPSGAHEQINFRNVITSQIQGIRGFTESDGFHGDGCDWYEFTLSTDLADQLRAMVGRLDHIKVVKESEFPGTGSSAPDWWPRHWSTDIKIYNWYNDYLILSDIDTKAWFLGMRM